jgi:hypothetical protein
VYFVGLRRNNSAAVLAFFDISNQSKSTPAYIIHKQLYSVVESTADRNPSHACVIPAGAANLRFYHCQIYRFSRGQPSRERDPTDFFSGFRAEFHFGVAAGVARQPVPVDFVGFFQQLDRPAVRVGRQVMPPDFILVFPQYRDGERGFVHRQQVPVYVMRVFFQ